MRVIANKRIRAITPVLLLLGIWWLATNRGWVSPFVLVPPGLLVEALLDTNLQTDLLAGLAASALRLAEGASLGIIGGLLFGTVLGLSPAIDRLIGPSFHAARQIAIFAWIPLLTAWFGNGDFAKIVFVAITAFYPTVMGTHDGIRSVSHQFIEVGRVLCLRRATMLRRIVFPAAFPSIVTGLQLALIYAWLGTIGAEYLMGGIAQGIGSLVMTGREQLRTDIVFIGIIAIATIGVTMNVLLRKASRHVFPWRDAA